MNSALAFEIYRGLWLIEGSESSFKNILNEARTAVMDPSQRLNTFSMISAGNYSRVQTTAAATSKSQEKKIAVANISGVITKSGGSSSRGMQDLSTDMLIADSDPEVVGHLVRLDTPGGSKIAMDYMKHTMQSLTKPIVTMVTRQGMAASAGLGLLSEGNWVMAESGDAQIGSHGVMWGVSGVPDGQKDGNGEVHFVVIADSSPDKNKAPLAAINNNDTSLMKDEVNKAHAGFKENTKALRPNAKDEHMTGAMFPASELVGTLIDAVGSETEAVNKILELSKTNNTFNTNLNNQQTKAMTAAELLAQHPTVHAEITAAGVAAERDRVETWMVYQTVDPEAVQKGIESGVLPSNKQMAAFNLKAATSGKLEALVNNSPKDLVPNEAELKEKIKTADEKEFEALYPKVNFAHATNAN